MSQIGDLSIGKFNKNIRLARQYVNNYTKVRWVICNLALECCDLSHGGRKSGVFSLKNFAEKIELNPKTLYEWIRIKKNVVDRLPKTIQENIHLEPYEELRSLDEIVVDSDSNREVMEKFKFIKNRNPSEIRAVKYFKHLRSTLFTVKNPVKMENVSEETIKKMIDLCEKIKICLLAELDLRKKLSIEDRKLHNLKITKQDVNFHSAIKEGLSK